MSETENLRSLRGGSVIHANSRYAASEGRYRPACGAMASGMSKLRMAWAVTAEPVTCKRCAAKNDHYRTAGRSDRVLSYLFDGAGQGSPVLAVGWRALPSGALEEILAVVEPAAEHGGAYYDGDAYAPLVEMIERELEEREYEHDGYVGPSKMDGF